MVKKKKSKLMFFLNIVVFIFLIVLLRFYGKVYQNGGGLQGVLITALGNNKKLTDFRTVYFLIMGVSTDLDTELTDTIMLCGYNPLTDEAMMLSIPRDTFIGKNKENAKGTDKINSLYSKGPEYTVEAVENITGLDIKYYAVIKNEVLINIVDIIGGVYFDVPIDMKYDDPTQNLHIDLKKGYQKINGEKAEQLLRFRHNNNGTSYSYEYGDNDYGRMKTQREFLKALISQTIKMKNISKIKEISKVIFENLETNFNFDDILPYIPYAIKVNIDDVIMEQLPGNSELCNGVWVFIHNQKSTDELILEIIDKLDDINEKNEE